jgi:hypothetical protein
VQRVGGARGRTVHVGAILLDSTRGALHGLAHSATLPATGTAVRSAAQCTLTALRCAVSVLPGTQVHFKGSAKPWRVFSCFGLREGRLVARPANVTLHPNDELFWHTPSRACISRRLTSSRDVRGGGETSWAAYAATYATSGLPLPIQCCRFTSLIKAEWWHQCVPGSRSLDLCSCALWLSVGSLMLARREP